MFIAFRLKPGRDDDLIEWAESLGAGDQSYHIRETLRRNLNPKGGSNYALPPSPSPVIKSNENKSIKSGDWVEGVGETLLASTMVYGIYITELDDEYSLIATYQQKRKNKKKIYVRVYNVSKTEKDKDAPRDLLSFAKKHDYYGK